MWTTIAFGCMLILASLGLVVSHVLARRSHESEHLDTEERKYRQLQFRRRMQASILIGVAGLAILAGTWVDGPPIEALYWCGVLLVVVWIVWLAAADFASTQSFFRNVHRDRVREHAALHDEIEQYYRHQSNGRHESKPPPSS